MNSPRRSEPVAVVTARAGSVRLPGKNMLPILGIPLALRAIDAARRDGIRTIVTTDIPELAEIARRWEGVTVVHRPPELATEITGREHRDAIAHALRTAAPQAETFILLQPTSPFRSDNTIAACVYEHRRTRLPVKTIYPGHLAQFRIWDGCVWVAAVSDIYRKDFHPIENTLLNSTQIDTPEDYAHALCLSRLALR